MKYAIVLFLCGTLVAGGPVKRQVPLVTTTIQQSHPVMPIIQPVVDTVVVRELVHPEPIVQTNTEMVNHEPQVAEKADISQTNSNDHSIVQENLPVNSNSEHINQENMPLEVTSALPVTTPVPVITSSFSSVGHDSSIISPGLNQESIRSGNNHQLDPHLSVNGQSFNPNMPLSQGSSGILLPNQGSSFPLSLGNLPNLAQSLTQGLTGFPLNQQFLPSYNSYAYPIVSPLTSYRSFPIYNEPIHTTLVLPPRPAYRQFAFPITTTTVAPDSLVHQNKDNFPVKGGNVRSGGVKGGMSSTRSGVKGF